MVTVILFCPDGEYLFLKHYDTLFLMISFSFPAFREVFDLFDSNGGGTIDAEELDLALQSVDIKLSPDEIHEVLTTMDRDGECVLKVIFTNNNLGLPPPPSPVGGGGGKGTYLNFG